MGVIDVEFDFDALHSLRFIADMSNPKSIAVARNATRQIQNER